MGDERLPRPPRTRHGGFVAAEPVGDKPVKALHEQGNPDHRVRVEHDKNTLFVHLSDEDGKGWTCLAVHRATRQWAVAQEDTQSAAAMAAYEELYRSE